MATVPTSEPTEIVIGETLKWTKYVPDYLPADGWTLKYCFRGASGPGFDITTIADGLNHLVDNFETSGVAGLLAGAFTWQAWVENSDDERHFITQGVSNIRPGLIGTEASAEADIRSDTKKALDAIRAKLASKATMDQLQYTIGDRQVQRYSFTELLQLEERFTQLYNQEVLRERSRKGVSFFQTVKCRFT